MDGRSVQLIGYWRNGRYRPLTPSVFSFGMTGMWFRFGMNVLTFHVHDGRSCRGRAILMNWFRQSVLQHHVVDWRQRETGTEDVFDARSLSVQRVDDRSALGH